MQASIEISLYPLQEAYIPPIDAFIARLNAHPELTVVTNGMSTQVFGPYATALAHIAEAMQATHTDTAKAAFVMKVLRGHLNTP